MAPTTAGMLSLVGFASSAKLTVVPPEATSFFLRFNKLILSFRIPHGPQGQADGDRVQWANVLDEI